MNVLRRSEKKGKDPAAGFKGMECKLESDKGSEMQLALLLNDDSVKEQVKKGMADPDYKIRLFMGDVLRHALHNDDTRQSAAEVLEWGLNAPDVDALPGWAKPTIRASSASVLKDAKADIGRFVPKLLELFADGSSHVQAMAKFAVLNAVKKDRSVLSLVEAELESRSRDVVQNAVFVLSEIGAKDKGVLVKLAHVLARDSEAVKGCHDVLASALDDSDEEVRVEVARGFADASATTDMKSALASLVKALFRPELFDPALAALTNEVRRDPRSFGMIEDVLKTTEVAAVCGLLPKSAEKIRGGLEQIRP